MLVIIRWIPHDVFTRWPRGNERFLNMSTSFGIAGTIHFTNGFDLNVRRNPITGECHHTNRSDSTGYFITASGKVVAPEKGKMVTVKGATFSGEI